MKAYLDLLADVYNNGVISTDRTGVGTRRVFGRQFRHDLSTGFPALTSKKIHWKSVAVELLWLLSGDTNIDYMKRRGVTIWDEWADEDGELGPVYGKQWRRWADHHTKRVSGEVGAPGTDREFWYITDTIDQIANLLEGIVKTPDSRRLIVTAWNPADVKYQSLPPCHSFFQVQVQSGGFDTDGPVAFPKPKLHMHMYQRSADVFLGVPFNIASYALLTHILAEATGCTPGELVISYGDLHLYRNHEPQAQVQLARGGDLRPLPRLHIGRNQITPEDVLNGGLDWADFQLSDYNPHPGIKADVAV